MMGKKGFLAKDAVAPVPLRIPYALCEGKIDILCCWLILPSVVGWGSALYKLTPWGGRAHVPHALAPQPLAFYLFLFAYIFARCWLSDSLQLPIFGRDGVFRGHGVPRQSSFSSDEGSQKKAT